MLINLHCKPCVILRQAYELTFWQVPTWLIEDYEFNESDLYSLHDANNVTGSVLQTQSLAEVV